ncbi:MAG: hypothetical protein JW820_01255 [Spirochaetales bacterium]|nr:hypothetical protein [Spirochaetales bacterium]
MRSAWTSRRLSRAAKPVSCALAGAVLWAAAAAHAPCLDVTSPAGFSIDLPSGFAAGEGDQKTRFSYLAPDGRMELAVLIYEPDRFASPQLMAEELLGTLGSSGERSSFTYEGREAVIADIAFNLAGGPRKGYALFLAGGEESAYALLAHAEASRFEANGELVISCLDAFAVDRAARRHPGPVSQFLLEWPPRRSEWKPARLPGGPQALPWSSEEARHELYVAQREHRVLSSYAESRTLWVDAWGRFYRMVYRESAARLQEVTDAFARLLPADDPTESARRVLAWVQGFTFERDVSGLDFVPPLAAAFEARGDCDARAMVMAIILEGMGIDCLLMLSREYSHAMLGVAVPGAGVRFPWGGREYLVAETTAKVGIGMIDASQADFSKWLGVELGEPHGEPHGEPRRE